MTGVDIPISTPGGAQAAETLRSISGALTGVGAAASATSKAFSFNEVRQAIVSVHGDITALASAVGELASEQSRLEANSSRLGLDFDAAADAAGRFTDETEAMTAATRLAEAGIRLNQQQLDALTRVAARFAQNTGTTTAQAIDQLTQGLITGSQRGLRPFGDELQAVAGSSHTAEQRLAALTEQASHTEQATDDAASSMARFGDSVDDMKRTLATAFTQGITDTLALASAADTAGNRFEILDSDIVQAGRSIGTVVVAAGNGIAMIVGGIATGIAAMLSATVAGASAAGAVIDRLRSGHVTGLGAAAAAAFNASVADSPITSALARFTEGRVSAAEAIYDRGLAGDEGNVYGARERRMADAATAAGAAAAARATSPAVSMEAREGGGRGRDEERKSAKAALMAADEALRAQQAMEERTAREKREVQASDARAEIELARETSEAKIQIQKDEIEEMRRNSLDARRERAALQRAETRAAQAAELADVRDPAVQRERLDEMRRAHTLDRERAHLQQRYEMQRSYVDRMEELHSTEADGTRALAEGVTDAFRGMGDAIAKHAQGLLDGKESVGEALQGMLSDTLASLAQQAVVKGAMETAEGIAALAGIVTAPLAPGHFAAAGAYFGVAALAGLGAAATAPSSSAAAPSAPAAAREPAARVSKGSAAGTGEGAVYNINFGGPMYGTGGVRRASREIVGVINRGAVQGGVQILPGALQGGGAGA